MAIARSSDVEVADALLALGSWVRVGDAIVRDVVCSSFADAVAFVTRIGFLAESADHHPDLDIRWRTVRISLSTHECNGLSTRDFRLAAEIDGVAVRFITGAGS
jgi:4a-hydroxytetrahydrobiopterin dehydratase